LETNESKIYTPTSYPKAVIQAGGTPVFLNFTRDDEMIEQYAAMVDGVLFSGGDDVDPASYDEEQIWGCGDICPLRDDFEIKLLKVLVEKYPEKPVLGICRGAQVLNVAMGGTLYQDLRSQVEGCIRHQQQQSSHYASHKAMVTEDSKLHAIYGSTEVMVNSFHHQAVKDVGEGLVVTARASDGVVEGLEKPDHPYFIAVQWHPERQVEGPHHPEHKPLFQSFVDACRK
jgi:putative glutamine amidotransferase